MMSTQNPVHFLQDSFSPDFDELFSLFQPDPTIQSTSGSETNRSVYSTEERKRRRMISNRESARRSRWRKKKQYEDLVDESNRLKLENREMKNWLDVLTNDCRTVQRDSNRLLTESIYLQHSLAGLHELLAPNFRYNN